MFEVIQIGEPTAARRRIYFSLIDSADNVSPKNITVTGVKVLFSKNGASAPAFSSTNDIVAVDATNEPGRYYIETVVGEIDTLGHIVGYLKPAGCLFAAPQATIVNYDPFAAAPDVNAIADALLDRVAAVDTLTPRQVLRMLLARELGQQIGLNSNTMIAKAYDGSKTRITATDDGAGGITFVNDPT